MPITLTSDSATIGTTEYYLASDSTVKVDQTTDCVLQVWIDFGALLAGDTYEVYLYEKINAGTQRKLTFYVSGVQSEPFVLPSMIVGDAWEVGVKKTAGTDRSIGWSLRKVS